MHVVEFPHLDRLMGRTLLSVCGVIAAVALFGAAPAQAQVGKQANYASQPRQLASQDMTTPKADDPERLYAACRKGEAKRGSDLCAQWYAADSAHEASIWTRRTGWFTGIGLIVGAITMVAAICAALFAKLAADHTKTGAEAAWAAEKVTRESAERQLRAYINVSDFYMTDVAIGSVPVGHFTIKNCGNTPAKALRVYFNVEFVENALPHKAFGYERTRRRAEWGPGHEAAQELRIDWVMSEHAFADLAQGNRQFRIAGLIIYKDVFGITRRFIFRAVSPNEGMTEGKLRMYRSKGRST